MMMPGTPQASGFVLDTPGGLSPRAREFLASSARRVEVDPGLPDGVIREQMIKYFGSVDEDFLAFYRAVQRRYLGLRYQSGYFDGPVTFGPTFEPDPDEPEPEIYYAVDTVSSVGASLDRAGKVKVGFDGFDAVEFDSLDGVIESDSVFAQAARLPVRSWHFEPVDLATVRGRVMGLDGHDLAVVPEANGRHSCWFAGSRAAVFYQSIWFDLDLSQAPSVNIWAWDSETLSDLQRIILAS